MDKFGWLLVLILLPLLSHAQRRKLDYDSIIIARTQQLSAFTLLPKNSATDSTRIALYTDLAYAYFRIDAKQKNLDSALHYNRLLITIYKQKQDANAVMNALNTRSDMYDIEGLYSRMIGVVQEMKNYCEATPTCNRLDLYDLNMGIIYQETGDTTRALYHFHKCLGETRSSVVRMNCCLNMGEFLMDINQPAQAIYYLDQALVIAKQSANRGGKVVGAFFIGNAYLSVNQLNKAKHFADEALQGNVFPSNIYFSHIYQLLGRIALVEKQADRAIEYADKALAAFGKIASPTLYDLYWSNRRSYDILYQAYKALRMPEEALKAHEMLVVLNRNIDNLQRKNELSILQRQFDAEKIELKNEKEKVQQKSAYESMIQYFKINQLEDAAQKQTFQKQVLEEKLEKEKLINQNARIRLEAETSRSLQEKKMKQLTISELNQKLHLQLQVRNFQRMVVALALILAAALIFGFYRYQLQQRTLQLKEAERRQRVAEFQEKEAQLQKRIAETEMAALRSQMNPHFIFNCLNSIQFYTAQNDAETATDYLTKFSRLIRLVLENSKSEKVTLKNELETLRLYLEMEAMRFHQKVRYSIEVDGEIDTDTVQIPPLLLQPFVENAIWHGLMHKEEGGTVRVDVQPGEHRLHIEVTDDGVGRQQAAAYQSKSVTKKKSFGMKLTAERIELINQLYQTRTQVNVVDLTDELGASRGTKVIVEIPI